VSRNPAIDAEIIVEGLAKRFGPREIFSRVGFTLATGDALAIVGRNGSGKSTLMKILANVTEKNAGSVRWRAGGNDLDAVALIERIGFVAPYLQLYGEFTAWEHAEMLQSLRGLPFPAERAAELFASFGLSGRRHDPVKTFSSGMTQRVKFICALVHDPLFLFLDEPTTNLDAAGIEAVHRIVSQERAGRITIVATNDPDDRRLCNAILSLSE
jgi:heme exporter protein A